MEERTKLELTLTKTDKLLEVIGWCVVLVLWMLTVYLYRELPETIPTHFDFAGRPDGFGKKINILSLPVIATVLYLGMTLLNKFPHIFNYPVKITAENALRQYTLATRLIRYLKLAVVIVFGIIALHTAGRSLGQTDVSGRWFLPTILGLIFIPLIIFIVRMMYKSKT